MNRDNFISETKAIELKRYDLLIGKGHDYATDDVLSNFKRMNKICELLNIKTERSAGDCARFLMMLKVDRWCNLINSNKKPQNESVKDTIMDLHNYIDLAHGCDIDEKH